MGGAREFLYVSVMEYFPTTRFRHPTRCTAGQGWGDMNDTWVGQDLAGA